MPHTKSPPQPDETPSQQASASDVFAGLDQFCILNVLEIASILRQLKTHQDTISVRPIGHENLILSSILDVDIDKGVFFYDCGGDSVQNQLLLASSENFVSAMPNGVPVQFLCGQPQQQWFQGALAFCSPLPTAVYRVQRRNAFRVGTPIGDPFICTANVPRGGKIDFAISDLSLTGVGLRSTDAGLAAVSVGAVARSAVLDFRKQGKMTVDLQISYVQKIQGNSNLYRVGCCLIDFSKTKEPDLQRLITYFELADRQDED